MLLVCQSILPPSLRGWENQAIFATRSPTAIRNIRPFRPRRKQIPETSRSGTSTTRRTRSRFLFDLPFSPWERVSADIKENIQPLPDDFSSFLPNSFRKIAMFFNHPRVEMPCPWGGSTPTHATHSLRTPVGGGRVIAVTALVKNSLII